MPPPRLAEPISSRSQSGSMLKPCGLFCCEAPRLARLRTLRLYGTALLVSQAVQHSVYDSFYEKTRPLFTYTSFAIRMIDDVLIHQ